MKLVINECYGGFCLSDEAKKMLGKDRVWDLDRSDEALINVVETLGKKANDDYSNLVVVDLPEETTDYEIDEYDGYESVTYVVDGKIYHK